MRYLFLFFIALATPATAEDVSPWFGSVDQTPFQMTSNGETAVPTAIDREARRDEDGSGNCAITGCSVAEGSAKVLSTGLISP